MNRGCCVSGHIRISSSFLNVRSCIQGLLQQNGSCVPAGACGCIHLQHRASGQPPVAVTVPQGGTVSIACSTW